MIEIVKEFIAFLGERKKFWLLPIVLILVLLGALIALSSSPIVAPFIYVLF